MVRVIRKQVVKKTLDLLRDVANEKPEEYKSFWAQFGAVLKEGMHYEPQHKDQLVDLLRYESSRGEGLVSLKEYVERMPEEQTAIYYGIGPSLQMLESSPHLENLRQRGFEVLYMVDTIDEWAVKTLGTYEEKSLVSAMASDLELADTDEAVVTLERLIADFPESERAASAQERLTRHGLR